ncbi:MAG: hypothetical protein JO142_10400 [Burkholderiales bacterium]|nr:hypothetical protein [Burkholderiales bacterium]
MAHLSASDLSSSRHEDETHPLDDHLEPLLVIGTIAVFCLALLAETFLGH